MSVSSVQYRVRMNQKIFRAFALFDTFRLKRHARLPAIFFCVMTAFAAIAVFSGKPQSGLLAAVLFCVGLGMPAIYIGTFLHQVKKQGQALGLSAPRLVYTVTLTREKITVHNDLQAEADIALKWDQLYRVIRRKDCFYLYAVPQKAFILPDRDADCGAAEALEFIRSRLPGKKTKS